MCTTHSTLATLGVLQLGDTGCHDFHKLGVFYFTTAIVINLGNHVFHLLSGALNAQQLECSVEFINVYGSTLVKVDEIVAQVQVACLLLCEPWLDRLGGKREAMYISPLSKHHNTHSYLPMKP